MKSTPMYIFPILVAAVILINGLYQLICIIFRKHRQRLSVHQSNDLEAGHHQHDWTNRWVNDNPLALLPVLAPCVTQVQAVADAMVYEGQQGKKKFVNDECVICLAGFEEGEVCHVLVNCKHAYHGQCIDQWMLRNTCCPICREHAEIRIRVTNLSAPSLT